MPKYVTGYKSKNGEIFETYEEAEKSELFDDIVDLLDCFEGKGNTSRISEFIRQAEHIRHLCDLAIRYYPLDKRNNDETPQ